MTDYAIPDDATLDAIDRWVAYRVWHSRTPGAQVAVGVGGRPFFSRAYGYADLDARTPMRTDHLFRIASHSKTFTATLVLQLAEQGRLGLDDPVGQHLAALADGPLAGVRLRELLEHTGGVLRDGRDADHWCFARPFPDADALLEMTVAGGLKTEPGERFAYSNLGYSLLGLVIEAVTGETFAAAARHQILAPLGLDDTDADYLTERAGDYAAGHSGLSSATRREVLGHVPTGAMAAATGFTSTATDLVTYFGAHALGDDRLLTDRSKRLQQRLANVTDPAKPEGVGYGWGMVTERVDDQTLVGHSGGYPGHITKTLLDPTTGLVVSVLTNAIDGPATPLALGVAQLLAGAVPDPDAVPVAEAALSWTGRYANLWHVIDLAAVGGRLRALSPTSWTPLDGADVLVDDGPDRLRIESGPGFGSVGEPVERDPDRPDRISYAGMSMQRLDELPDPL
ncbi:serine hydrolase domain-containing protein [uncultured Friedmanniella sp.]|uniref:serine hydrolase domain-containing protein n=1 Tax=uncultured Friedmanniella sp. TaxID=335381 RepID=UPI0035CAC13E